MRHDSWNHAYDFARGPGGLDETEAAQYADVMFGIGCDPIEAIVVEFPAERTRCQCGHPRHDLADCTECPCALSLPLRSHA